MILLRTLVVLAISTSAFSASAPKGSALSDGAIEADIRARFAKSKINEEHFQVSVKAGVALLQGKTAVPQRKGVATRLAKSGGARQVVNKIEVSEAARKQLTDRLHKGRERSTPPQPRSEPRTSASAPSTPPTATVSATASAAPPRATPAAPTPVAESGPQPLRRMQIKR
jgi:hypothetical protein